MYIYLNNFDNIKEFLKLIGKNICINIEMDILVKYLDSFRLFSCQ